MCGEWQEKQRVQYTIGKDVRGMLKRTILLAALAALLFASAAEAIVPGKGRQGRKLLRYSYYAQFLQNDKLQVYQDYGYPVHRLRVFGYGEVLEHWFYYEDGIEFVFDGNSNLVKTCRFQPMDKRVRLEEFPGYGGYGG